MPPAARLSDQAQVPACAHGCPACPHPGVGPSITASGDTNVNNLPALRLNDPGMHTACCVSNTWKVSQGSQTVLINGKPAARQTDQTRHCGGFGTIIMGSPDVIIGGPPTAAASAAPSSGSAGSSTNGTAGSGATGSGSSSGGGASGGGGSSASGGSNGSIAGSDPSSVVNGGGSTPDQKKPDDDKVFVINSTISSPGGTPLAGEDVLLFEPGTDKQIGGPFTTDATGSFAAIVPENKPYEARIVDTGGVPAERGSGHSPTETHLHLSFTDDTGTPLANESISITGPDGSSISAKLDEYGLLDMPAAGGEHSIALRGQTFQASTLAVADLDEGGTHYAFEIAADVPSVEAARANRYSPSDDEGAEA
ncbi:MAG TPA: PAAR domain-containing protein [Kofleriaceae bacterium]